MSRIHVDGGAIFGNPKKGAWWRPGRENLKASSSARQTNGRSFRICKEEKWKPLRGEQPGFKKIRAVPGEANIPPPQEPTTKKDPPRQVQVVDVSSPVEIVEGSGPEKVPHRFLFL
jgi:hypothetical protein